MVDDRLKMRHFIEKDSRSLTSIIEIIAQNGGIQHKNIYKYME